MLTNININLTVTDEDIDDIVCTALEGGITYWCYKCEVVGDYLGEYASDQISRGGKLKLYDNEEDEVYVLDKEKLINGIRIAANHGYCMSCPWVENGKLDTYNIDALCADVIVQCALFDDVIFG